jgi:ferredoxin
MAAKIIRQNCIGCGWCIEVCHHQILRLDPEKKVIFTNEALCIECGACALQCPSNALIAHPEGCGCVSGVVKKKLRKWLGKKESTSCC